MSNEVCNTGVVKEIRDGKAIVSIVRTAACVSCQLSGSCNSAEVKTESIEVPLQNNKDIQVGDKVDVVIKESKGLLAVVFAFFLPILLIVFAIALSNAWLKDDALASLVGLGVGISYYLILLLLNSQMKKTFQFTIRKHEDLA